jgi:hypothetical protein
VPDEVTGVFSLPNSSSHTMAPVVDSAPTEMSIRNIPGGIEQPSRKADNLTGTCEPIVQTMYDPRRLTTL